MRKALFTAILVACGSLAQAASPLATLSTSGAVEVSGSELSTAAVTVWPIVAGDEIATKDTAAVLLINGQSRVTLRPNSKVKIDTENGRTIVSLVSGFFDYMIVANANLSVRSSGKVFSSGSGSIDSKGAAAPAPTALFAAPPPRGPVSASNSF